jgi:iron(III)-enterobactin esterase
MTATPRSVVLATAIGTLAWLGCAGSNSETGSAKGGGGSSGAAGSAAAGTGDAGTAGGPGGASGTGVGGTSAGVSGSGGSIAGSSGSARGGSGAGLGGAAGVQGGAGTSGGTAAAGTGGAVGGNGGTAGGNGGAAAGTGGAAGGAGGAAGGGGLSGAGGAGGGRGGAGGAIDPGTDGDGNFTISGPYNPARDSMAGLPGIPQGFMTGQNDDLVLANSAIFAGSHRIRVFVPSQYVDGSEAAFMIAADGIPGINADILVNAVRNRAAATDARKVPPLIVIGVTPGSDRSSEYDTVSDRYWRFITTEVLPAVLTHGPIKSRFPNLKFTARPEGRGVYGCSSGGTAALGMAWFGDFTRVLSFSGSFTSLKTSAQFPNGAWDYPRTIMSAPLRPTLRIFTEVGSADINRGGTQNWIQANVNLADVLTEKGYHHRFVRANGADHCNRDVTAQILPESLMWLWRGYVPN